LVDIGDNTDYLGTSWNIKELFLESINLQKKYKKATQKKIRKTSQQMKKPKPPDSESSKSKSNSIGITKIERVINTRFQKLFNSPYRERIESAVYRLVKFFLN
jgi:hypothetical protein